MSEESTCWRQAKAEAKREAGGHTPTPDYGADPVGNGMFKMIPSGDIVSKSERDKRLPLRPKPADDIFGMSWSELERRQGGRLKI